jgi:pyruvate-formate lyase-activating enzyme
MMTPTGLPDWDDLVRTLVAESWRPRPSDLLDAPPLPTPVATGTPGALGVTGSTEIILQPFGSFVWNSDTRRNDTLSREATALLLAFAPYRVPGSVTDWLRSMSPDTEPGASIETMVSRGYLGPAGGVPTVSDPSTRGDLKVTRAEIEITNRCNLRCRYCYAEANHSKTELDAAKWKEILTALHRRGLRAALITGGEPFLHPEIMEVLSLASDLFIVDLNTNGTYITPEIADRIAELRLNLVQISLDSLEPTHHDALRGKGSHAKALNAIHLLAERDVAVQVAAVVTARNRNQMPALADFAHSLGARFEKAPVTRTGFAQSLSDEEWDSDFSPHPEDRMAEEAAEATLGFVGMCQNSMGSASISPTGTFKPCNMRETFFSPTREVVTASAALRWWERPHPLAGLDLQRGHLTSLGSGHPAPCALQRHVQAHGRLPNAAEPFECV